MNDHKHGKGILYYKNGTIKYDGDFVNGRKEGNGKYIYEDGNYYIGEWLNNRKNGRGILYKSDGNIIYTGVFINDNHNSKCSIQ